MVLVDRDDFQHDVVQLILKEKEDLFGRSGWCGINNDKIVKIYNDPVELNQHHNLTQFHSDKIAFPIEYYVDKASNMVVGELMKYYNKKCILYTFKEDSNIDVFLNSYTKILKEISKFPNIRMYDLVAPNILYDEATGFTLIDTFDWIIRNNCNNIDLNKEDFNKNFIYMIVNEWIKSDGCFDNFRRYGQDGKDFVKVVDYALNENKHLYELIGLFRLLVNEVLDQSVDTLGDVKKYTKILTK